MNQHTDPTELPASFFADVAAVSPAAPPGVRSSEGLTGWKPTKSMLWYDSIIDDILANPGTSIKETAKRLGRHPQTISLVVGSDLFRARWAQRRAQFNDALESRLTAKLAVVAEKSLDATIQILDKKRESIPLPVLNDVVKNSLDRLGYGPSAPQAAPAVQVNVSSNVVSAEALARARENLKVLEAKTINPKDSPAQRASVDRTFEPEGFPREASVRQSGSETPAGSAGNQLGAEGED